jgi:Flp pilus assembly protein TadD
MLIRPCPSWGMIGLLGGIAAGLRPDVLVPLAFVLCFRLLHFARAEGVRKAVAKTVFLAAGFLAIAGPLTVRNYVLTGQGVLFSSNAGINFYTGNGPTADGVSAIPTGLAWEKIISTVPEEIMREPASVSRLWFSRGFDAIAQDPIAWLKLIGKKAFAFFNGLEFRNNIGYSWFREDVPYLNIPFIQYWPVSALAILGLCLCIVKRRRIPERNIILLWIAGYFVVGLAFFVTARFRLPAVPFMIICGTWASYWLYRRCAGSMKGVGQSVFLVALIFGVTWPGWIESTKDANSRDYINLGNVLRKNGELQKAISAYKKASGVNPEEPEGWFLAGTTYLNLNRPEEAIDYLTRAAGLCPTGADIMLNLGGAYFLKGNVKKAEDQYKALVKLADKTNLYHKRNSVAKAHIGLWRLYGSQGKKVEATKQMEHAWQVDEQVAAEYSVMNGLELERAARVLERLAQEEPWNWYPRANLGIAYLKMGRFEQAAAELKKSSGLKGSLPGVRFHLGLALINSGKKGEGLEILKMLLDELPKSGLRNQVKNVLNSIK